MVILETIVMSVLGIFGGLVSRFALFDLGLRDADE